MTEKREEYIKIVKECIDSYESTSYVQHLKKIVFKSQQRNDGKQNATLKKLQEENDLKTKQWSVEYDQIENTHNLIFSNDEIVNEDKIKELLKKEEELIKQLELQQQELQDIDNELKEQKVSEQKEYEQKEQNNKTKIKQLQNKVKDLTKQITVEKLEIEIEYVHDDKEPETFHFDPNIVFDGFKRKIVDRFGFSQHEAAQLKIGRKRNGKIISITSATFNLNYMKIKQIKTLYIGFDPDIPIIENIDSDIKGQIEIKLKSKSGETFYFDIESEMEENQIEFDSSNTTQNLITGINPSGKYRVRVKATNLFGESKWSEWSEYIQQISSINELKDLLGKLHEMSEQGRKQLHEINKFIEE
eukprot:538314_1